MHFSILSLIFGASLCLGVPTGQDADTAKLALTNRITGEPNGYKVPGPVALAEAYAKYNVPVPANLKAAAASATQTGVAAGKTSVPFDLLYLYPVTVGSNKLMLDFDTGSADFWVFSTELMKRYQFPNHTLYNPNVSGKKWKHESWVILYADESGALGNVWNDTIQVGGIKIPNQAVEAAHEVTYQFQQRPGDGIMGFAFDSQNQCSPHKCATPFQNMQKSLALPLFTVTLRHNKPGEFDFGFIDRSKYTGNIVTVPNTGAGGTGSWGFALSGYSIGNGKQVNRVTGAIADTGTTLTLLGKTVIKKYYAAVPGAEFNSNFGGYTFPCSATLQDFSLYIGGQKRTMPAAYVNVGPIDNAGNCFGGLQSQGKLGYSIIGDTFLKSQFVVYDTGNNTIGFAQQAGVPV